MPKRKRVNVCSINVLVSGVRTYGGGHVVNARDIGTYAGIGKQSAQRLVRELDVGKLPRPGWEKKLCDDTWLVNKGGRFEIDRRSPGGLRGLRGMSKVVTPEFLTLVAQQRNSRVENWYGRRGGGTRREYIDYIDGSVIDTESAKYKQTKHAKRAIDEALAFWQSKRGVKAISERLGITQKRVRAAAVAAASGQLDVARDILSKR